MSEGESVHFPVAVFPFCLHQRVVLYSKFYPSYLHSICDQISREKQPYCLHIRSYPIPKGFQPYKGMHAYINGFIM